tara:strand:+ start:384 stop:518 length:135 start_codon:yes stop_codon:yes gene_type:complete
MSTRTTKWLKIIRQAKGRNVIIAHKPAKVANIRKLVTQVEKENI